MNKITRQSLQQVQDHTEYRTCSFHLQHNIFRLKGCIFHHCSFRSWTVLISRLENCMFINCNFAGINIEHLINSYFQRGFIEDLKITPYETNAFESFQEVNIANLNISWTDNRYAIINYHYGFAPHPSPLTEIPEEIFDFSTLKELNLSRNQLSSVSPKIQKLNNLRSLSLRSNKLKKLPVEIGKLTKLEELDLYNNQIGSLPSAIANLKQLRLLRLPSYRTSIPFEMQQLENLEITYDR
ncbi:leucine-rich repeat domain-containing protein [Candidatus Uabimicrobium amorphum]|uniref:Membrane protein n=1 Tax=Uabimicrobium amorphum TaxID=2596890 RepID=A0A5S9F5E5_UABAM|nr:leucine-rich repeat domain-containing protein [Candidatus Uabimicrobium amorphum]BBM85182.1 membrane protein [Candidatus Uabimicrobium amorphum]